LNVRAAGRRQLERSLNQVAIVSNRVRRPFQAKVDVATVLKRLRSKRRDPDGLGKVGHSTPQLSTAGKNIAPVVVGIRGIRIVLQGRCIIG
jgi:hypothetical protein